MREEKRWGLGAVGAEREEKQSLRLLVAATGVLWRSGAFAGSAVTLAGSWLTRAGAVGLASNGRSALRMRMNIERILLGINRGFFQTAVNLDDLVGVTMGFMVLTVAAAESAIGLALLVVYHRKHGSRRTADMSMLRDR